MKLMSTDVEIKRCILDTNILISALFGGNAKRIFFLFLEEQIEVFYSEEVLIEYQEVLFRKKFEKFSKTLRLGIIEQIHQLGIFVIPKIRLNVIQDDPADNRFLECTVTAEAGYLITGNKKHFTFSQYEKVKIVNPTEFK